MADHLGEALSQALARLRTQTDSADLAAGYRSAGKYLEWFVGQLLYGHRPATPEEIRDAVRPYRNADLGEPLPPDKVIDLVVAQARERLHGRGLFCHDADLRRTELDEF